MDYFERQIVNEANSIIDEYLEAKQFNQILANRTMLLMVHFIRAQYVDEPMHESNLPMKGVFGR